MSERRGHTGVNTPRSSAALGEALQLIGLALACRLDGGFSPAIQSALQSTFQSYQPRVVAFNGGGATQNAVRWVGTEGDMWACACTQAQLAEAVAAGLVDVRATRVGM